MEYFKINRINKIKQNDDYERFLGRVVNTLNK